MDIVCFIIYTMLSSLYFVSDLINFLTTQPLWNLYLLCTCHLILFKVMDCDAVSESIPVSGATCLSTCFHAGFGNCKNLEQLQFHSQSVYSFCRWGWWYGGGGGGGGIPITITSTYWGISIYILFITRFPRCFLPASYTSILSSRKIANS